MDEGAGDEVEVPNDEEDEPRLHEDPLVAAGIEVPWGRGERRAGQGGCTVWGDQHQVISPTLAPQAWTLGTAPEDVRHAGRRTRQEVMWWQPPAAQVCKPLLQPALLGLGWWHRPAAVGTGIPIGDRKGWGSQSDEKALGEQLP